jgi:hypothetical protein
MLEVSDELSRDCVRKNDVELNDETALFKWIFELGHAFAHHALDFVVFDHFAWQTRDDKIALIECLDDLLEAAERLNQLQVHDHSQIGAISKLKHRMLFHVQDNDDVAWLQIGFLIALAVEDYPLPILHALLNVHLEDLPITNRLLSIAGFAAVFCINYLTLSLARAADLFVFLHEARHDLLNLNLNALALASAASLDSALFPAATLALFADDILLEC